MTAMPDFEAQMVELGATVAAMAAVYLETFAPFREAAAGYAAQCISAGFDQEAASRMGADLHRTISVLFVVAASKPAEESVP